MADFSQTVKARLQAFLAGIVTDRTYCGFEKSLLKHVQLLQNPSHALSDTLDGCFRLVIQDFMCNKDGFLHDGGATTPLDNLSSTAFTTIQRPDFWENLGVSRSTNVAFHRAVSRRARAIIRSSLIAAGKKLATVRAVVLNDRGESCMSCIHDKSAVWKSSPQG